MALLCAQASNAQTPILVLSQSAIKMPAEVADFPLIFIKYASYKLTAYCVLGEASAGEHVALEGRRTHHLEAGGRAR